MGFHRVSRDRGSTFLSRAFNLAKPCSGRQQWALSGPCVRVHDFKLPELGKVAPYGVYDIAANHGWVSIGVDADTAAFAVESIRRWWQKLGRARYPDAHSLTITADCGGSNGVRVKLWKRELQRFANETGLTVTVTHLPPGTSSRVDDWRGGSRSRGV